jgi:hypothetical protein
MGSEAQVMRYWPGASVRGPNRNWQQARGASVSPGTADLIQLEADRRHGYRKKLRTRYYFSTSTADILPKFLLIQYCDRSPDKPRVLLTEAKSNLMIKQAKSDLLAPAQLLEDVKRLGFPLYIFEGHCRSNEVDISPLVSRKRRTNQ